MNLTGNKDLKKLLKEAEDAGWGFSTHRGHIKGKHSTRPQTKVTYERRTKTCETLSRR